MATSPSSSSGAAGQLFSIWLLTATGRVRVAKVDVPWPLPAILQYQGNYYAYSGTISSGYVQATPYVPATDLGAPQLSVLAFPQY